MALEAFTMKHVLLCLCVALLAVSGDCWAAAADVEPSARRQPEAESWQPPPSLDVLPSSRELPELVRFANGRKVATRAQWGQRRKEMKAMVQYFEYGHLPPRPDVVRAAGVTSRALQDGTGVQQRITLVIGSAQRLKMRVAISRPTGEKRCPVMVAEVHSISPLPCIPMFLKHGYMFVQYQREDLAAPEKNGLHYRDGQHDQTMVDWRALLTFAQGHFDGQRPAEPKEFQVPRAERSMP
jgi:hypothetical protein